MAEELRRVLPGRRGARRRGCAGVRRHDARRGGGASARGPVRRSSTTSAVAWPTPRWPGWWPAAGVPFVAMHWRGHSADMQSQAVYDDVVADVVVRALASGPARSSRPASSPSRIVLDPGFGFAKLTAHNWSLLRGLERAARARPPGPRRHLAQDLPRPGGGRRRRRPAATAGPRRGDRRDVDARGPTGGVGRAGAPRALDPRRDARRPGHRGRPMRPPPRRRPTTEGHQ